MTHLIKPYIKPLNLDEIARAVANDSGGEGKPKTPDASDDLPKAGYESLELTPKDFIILPSGKDFSGVIYPNLEVCLYRLGETDEIKKRAQELGIDYETSAREIVSGRNYIGKINWEQAIKLSLALGRTLTAKQGLDLAELLNNYLENKAEIRDVEGNLVKKDKIEGLKREMFSKEDPWRAEWLDSKFKKKGRKLNINFGYELQNRVLAPKYSFAFDDSFKAKCRELGLTYWAPFDGSVALFDVDSCWAYLNCIWHPVDSYSSLGVRLVREAPQKT